jgi:hypothetical protein
MVDHDDRKALEVLKAELDFMEKGGYGRSVREPWKPTSVFQDSPTCLCYPERQHENCCFLMQMVPDSAKTEAVPCHHIPLNEKGDTICSLEEGEDQQALEETVRDWLKESIAKLEAKAVQASGQ